MDSKESMGGGEEQRVDVRRTDESEDSGTSQGEMERSQDRAEKESEALSLTKSTWVFGMNEHSFSFFNFVWLEYSIGH